MSLAISQHRLIRVLAFSTVLIAIAYLINNFLIFGFGFPGVFEGGRLAILTYAIGLAVAVGLTLGRRAKDSLEVTSRELTQCNQFMIRGCFWAILLVGMVDAAISFLYVEGWLPQILGTNLADKLGSQDFRGAYLHLPVLILGFLFATISRGLGFIWLVLLVFLAELLIVIGGTVYSYEQTFLSDLVRLWYAALFIFGAANALVTEGHVRVDVLFSKLSHEKKSLVNLWGSILLGMPFAWAILLAGTWTRGRVVNAPILNFEIGQEGGSGLYIKYLMAGFLLVLALSLILQFGALILSSANSHYLRAREEIVK
ncbi:MAG: TRAP transporter small permease subunit [Alphaproteobacteria bacterium]